MPREQGEKVVATNRKARHDYTIEDTYEAGIVLSGTEVKSLREGRASLVDGYAFIDVKISHRTKEGGYTLVPLRIYFKDGKAKVELAVAKGKREYDKRQALRERQDKREADRAMSSRRHLGE